MNAVRVASPVLVIEHQGSCPPGWLGTWIVAEGAALQITRPYAGDPIPGDLAAYRGLVVLGGSMGAGDDADVPWLAPARALVREAAERAVPTLGVCLGHQLAATALGGQVGRNPRGPTRGLQQIGWTAAAATDPLFGRLAARDPHPVAVQWNDDIVTAPPPGSIALALAGSGELLAARFAPTVWGVQWHPEAGADIVGQWTAWDRERAARRELDLGELDLDAALAAIRTAQPTLRRTWRALGTGFAELVRGR